jgi:hypothetical protein
MSEPVRTTSRRSFLKQAAAVPALRSGGRSDASSSTSSDASPPARTYRPGRIPNEYVLLLPGERRLLAQVPRAISIGSEIVTAALDGQQKKIKVGDSLQGWKLLAIIPWLNGIPTVVFEKNVTHRGVIVYATEEGEIARIPKYTGNLSSVRPRPINAERGVEFERPEYVPAPDVLGNYILNSDEDPCYENVAALGKEYTGWTLVANEEIGPEKSLWLEPDGRSREFGSDPQSLWAPDLTGRLFEPEGLLPSEYLYDFVPGYSKRTLLGGFLPAADIGVWNPRFNTGYEVMLVLPPGPESHPVGRVRAMLPSGSGDGLIPRGDTNGTGEAASRRSVDQYWNGSAGDFFSALVGVWNKWNSFFEDRMKVKIPDEWQLSAARAGIVLCRCSYHGLKPTYQIGEGAYTKIPERSHALFPVAHYEFVWAQQLWNLTDEVEPYFQYYLDHYILPDGNFLYNTQDQVEAPLDAGVFLENSARAYDYTHDLNALRRRLPILSRMAELLRRRYVYSKEHFPPNDRRHGLIWGSPEADNGDPDDDYPDSHPYYYQNAAWTWRGFNEHARCLRLAGDEGGDSALRKEALEVAGWADQIRADVERSITATMVARDPAMKKAGITPFTPFDTHRKPTELSSYENHRYMEDWWTSDWGNPELDLGHFRHREIAGEQILGMNTDGAYPRTSNFMSHGTLAGRIRQDDYRPFLLTLYALCCYTMDCGNRYSPEDALLPGSYAGEGNRYGWSAVVNSELQPAMGLRWLLCYEERDRTVVHLQKAAPKHWFSDREEIHVEHCPTRFGPISWNTRALPGGISRPKWQVAIQFLSPFSADLVIHIHPPDRNPLRRTSFGQLQQDRVTVPSASLKGRTELELEIV